MNKKFILAAAALMLVSAGSFAKKAKKEVLFGVKSCVITLSTEMNSDFGDMQQMFQGGGAMGGASENNPFADMFSNNEQKIYFDDYGRKMVTIRGNSRILTDEEGATITINDEQKTATKMPSFGGMGGMRMGGGMMGGSNIGFVYGSNGQPIDLLNATEKTLKKNKLTSLGMEEVANVICEKFSMKTSSMGYSSETILWVYEGIVIQTATDSEFMSTTQTVSNVEVNVDIPQDMFEVGSDITVSENSFGGMGGMGGGMMMMGGGGFGGGGMGGGFGGGMGGGFGGF